MDSSVRPRSDGRAAARHDGGAPGVTAARVALWCEALAVCAGGVTAATVLASKRPIGSPFTDGIRPAIGLDPLSAIFLLVVAVAAAPVLVFATAYLAHHPRRGVLSVLTGAFIAAMVLVVCARDITSFLAGWELMTLVPAAAILVHRTDADVRRAIFVYLAVTHLGGTGVWLAMMLLAHAGALADPGSFAMQPAAVRWTVWVAAVAGFGTKAGLMPMHSWLPRAHPVAPAHISALMSGVMVKVAIYGLIRVLFFWAAPVPPLIAVTLLALGALSCVGGIMYALFQHQLKRLLAFSSIENVGIITLGLGAALLFIDAHQPLWASLAFAAALLHTVNHALFKSLLFLGAGAVEQSAGVHHLGHLGGLLRRIPWTASCMLIGMVAIAGLPPLNGFVSEWLTLQSLFHLALDRAGMPWAGPLAAAALGAGAAMAVLCFVKVTGLVLLGPPRHPDALAATEVAWEMRAGQVMLAAMCVLLGLLPGLLIPQFAGVLGGGTAIPGGVQMAIPGTGGLPLPAVAVALGGCFLVLRRVRRGGGATAPSPTWACGQTLEPSLLWTSSAFTKPLRLSWEMVLRPIREVAVVQQGGVVQSARYHGYVPHTFDTVLYAPAVALAMRFASHARRLQSGHLRTYSKYLGGLLVVLLVLARIGVVR